MHSQNLPGGDDLRPHHHQQLGITGSGTASPRASCGRHGEQRRREDGQHGQIGPCPERRAIQNPESRIQRAAEGPEGTLDFGSFGRPGCNSIEELQQYYWILILGFCIFTGCTWFFLPR